MQKVKKVRITTLGCKVNQFESAAFKTGFTRHGMTIVDQGQKADLVVINTCAVTGTAGAQSRKAIRQALRQNPEAEIIITGCYAELASEELAAEKELKGRKYHLIGNSKKDQLVKSSLGEVDVLANINMGTINQAREICRLPVKRFGERSRAYLRIQDGCESYCSYCIVPYTRGPSRSLPEDEVIEQAKTFSAEGHKEIVLTGIHLGYYGNDLQGGGENNLITLLDRLSLSTPETSYRISSLEPTEISEPLLQLMEERKNIQPHLHIPLQSGHDHILARMNRRYTTTQFREVIERCHSRLPDAAIGIDILAGFPGETEEQFTAAKEFLKSLYFSYLHVFPYSIRPGTKAAEFKDQVDKQTKDRRVAELRLLSDSKKQTFYLSQLQRQNIRPVFVEGRRDLNGMLKGFTDNYINVLLNGPDSLLNSVIPVRLLHLKDNCVIGETIDQYES